MVAHTSDVLKKRFYCAAGFAEYLIYLPRIAPRKQFGGWTEVRDWQ